MSFCLWVLMGFGLWLENRWLVLAKLAVAGSAGGACLCPACRFRW
ncbi:hypothetical protein ABH935_003234 [Catenulispora sp. GAS73]